MSEVVRYCPSAQTDVFWKGNRGANERPWQSRAEVGGGRQGGRGEESIHPFASVAADFSANLSELTSEKFSWRLTGCRAGQAAERGSNCFWQVFAQSHDRYGLFPHANHAMPLWPSRACVRKQTSRVTGNPKCHPKLGLWLITPHPTSMQTCVQHLLLPWNTLKPIKRFL